MGGLSGAWRVFWAAAVDSPRGFGLLREKTFSAHLELGAERLRRALAEAQEAHENVLLGILVGQEGLPAPVCDVVAADKLDLKGPHLEVKAVGGTVVNENRDGQRWGARRASADSTTPCGGSPGCRLLACGRLGTERWAKEGEEEGRAGTRCRRCPSIKEGPSLISPLCRGRSCEPRRAHASCRAPHPTTQAAWEYRCCGGKRNG